MNRKRWLTPGPVIGFIAVFLGLLVPMGYWLDWANPAIFDIRNQGWPSPWAEALTAITFASMAGAVLLWIFIGRAIDMLALYFLLNGLIICGYFVLNLSAPVIYGAEKTILTAGEQAVAINAIGFLLMLGVMACWYVAFARSGRVLRPLRAPPSVLDSRLRWFLLPGVGIIVCMIVLPMILTRTIPMLSHDPMAGRAILEKSNIGRPLYNLGSSLLPALNGSLLVLAMRRRGLIAKVLSPEFMLAGIAGLAQFLTSNRLPLAVTLLVFVALTSMERKFPRIVLVVGVAGFMTFFLGLSGFSSIIRQNREALSSDNLLVECFKEAFLGDNLADLRDAAWVFGEWDFKPLDGKTYLGGLASFLPSAIFPQKKEWYLGLVAIRIVHWPPEKHFGLRITFFAESFLNFGLAGVVGLAVCLGGIFAYLLRMLHLAAAESPPCLARNLSILMRMQLALTLGSSSEGFVFWSICVLLTALWLVVERPIRWMPGAFRARPLPLTGGPGFH